MRWGKHQNRYYIWKTINNLILVIAKCYFKSADGDACQHAFPLGFHVDEIKMPPFDGEQAGGKEWLVSLVRPSSAQSSDSSLERTGWHGGLFA